MHPPRRRGSYIISSDSEEELSGATSPQTVQDEMQVALTVAFVAFLLSLLWLLTCLSQQQRKTWRRLKPQTSQVLLTTSSSEDRRSRNQGKQLPPVINLALEHPLNSDSPLRRETPTLRLTPNPKPCKNPSAKAQSHRAANLSPTTPKSR